MHRFVERRTCDQRLKTQIVLLLRFVCGIHHVLTHHITWNFKISLEYHVRFSAATHDTRLETSNQTVLESHCARTQCIEWKLIESHFYKSHSTVIENGRWVVYDHKLRPTQTSWHLQEDAMCSAKNAMNNHVVTWASGSDSRIARTISSFPRRAAFINADGKNCVQPKSKL